MRPHQERLSHDYCVMFLRHPVLLSQGSRSSNSGPSHQVLEELVWGEESGVMREGFCEASGCWREYMQVL